MVTTVCPHHWLDCHHDHPAQARRRRHLLRTPRPLPRPAAPPALPGAVARRANAGLYRRREAPAAEGQRQDQGGRRGQAPRPAPPARQGHHSQGRLRPLHAPAGRRGLARARAGGPLGQDGHQEPERPRADPGRHRRPETPRPDRRRRPPGTRRHGRRVLHRRGLDGAPGAQARHPARRSQRSRQPQRRDPGRHAQRPARQAVQVSHPGPGPGGHDRRPRPCP